MKRDIAKLAEKRFDLLVIGAGIHGALIARKAAMAGFRVALVDQGDFGHATSANSLKILHGGLRYLQHLDIRRMRESVRSRREMIRFAPHLIQPLECLIPTYGHGIKSKELMGLGLVANALVSWDRNLGVPADKKLLAGKPISRRECLNRIPGIEPNGLRGGLIWHDALAVNTERLCLEFVLDAVAYGSCAANYLRIESLVIENHRVIGADALDLLTQTPIRIQADQVVNAAGPWLEKLLPAAALGADRFCGRVKAINLIVKKPLFGSHAVGLEGEAGYRDAKNRFQTDKRFYFFVPWRDHTLIGTDYHPYEGHPDDFSVTLADIEGFLEDINAIHPLARLTTEDVSFFHAGILPAAPEDGNQPAKHSQIIVHERQGGIAGLFTVKGVKYTTAPRIAADMLMRLSGGRLASFFKKRPAKRPSGDDERGGPPVFSSLPAAVRHAINQEMAMTLCDIMFRRTDLGTAGRPPLYQLNQVAGIAADQLGWDADQKAEQVQGVLARYHPLIPPQTGFSRK